MGAIYLERLHSDAALQSFLEAAEVEKRLHGENAVEVGRILLSIAGVHDARADEDSALAAYSDAFRVLKSNLGNDDLSVALALIENLPSELVTAPIFDVILNTVRFSTSIESATILPFNTFLSICCPKPI